MGLRGGESPSYGQPGGLAAWFEGVPCIMRESDGVWRTLGHEYLSGVGVEIRCWRASPPTLTWSLDHPVFSRGALDREKRLFGWG